MQSNIQFFRESSQYIHAHKGKTFCIFLPHFNNNMPDNLDKIIADLVLLHAFDIKIIVIIGFTYNFRPTTDLALEQIILEVSKIRTEFEKKISFVRKKIATKFISSNFIIARGYGVIDGVDFENTGRIRKVDIEGINDYLSKDMVLLTPIGYSPTGDAFFVSGYDIVKHVGKISDKLIILKDVDGIYQKENLLRELNTDDARLILNDKAHMLGKQLLAEESLDVMLHSNSYEVMNSYAAYKDQDFLDIQIALDFVECYNRRCHILNYNIDGVLLTELFTRAGAGTLVAKPPFESLRKASIEDVQSILNLIDPLIKQGLLLARTHMQIENEIKNFTVVEHESQIIACASLNPLTEQMGEFACLAVHQDYRKQDKASLLLKNIIDDAKRQNFKQVIALTTQAGDWFYEHGFIKTNKDILPENRHYNSNRNSQVYSLYI